MLGISKGFKERKQSLVPNCNMPPAKPKVLLISDPGVTIRYCHHHFDAFQEHFEVIINEDYDRQSFIKALKSGKYVKPCLRDL